MRVGKGLEGEGNKRGVGGRRDHLASHGLDRPLGGRRDKLHNRVEEGLNPTIRGGGAAEHRDDCAVVDAAVQLGEELVVADRLIFQVAHHEVFVVLGDGLDERLPVFLAVPLEIVGDRHRLEAAVVVVVEDHCLARE